MYHNQMNGMNHTNPMNLLSNPTFNPINSTSKSSYLTINHLNNPNTHSHTSNNHLNNHLNKQTPDSLRSTSHSATNSTTTPTDHSSFMPPIGVINHSNNSSPSITSTAIVNTTGHTPNPFSHNQLNQRFRFDAASNVNNIQSIHTQPLMKHVNTNAVPFKWVPQFVSNKTPTTSPYQVQNHRQSTYNIHPPQNKTFTDSFTDNNMPLLQNDQNITDTFNVSDPNNLNVTPTFNGNGTNDNENTTKPPNNNALNPLGVCETYSETYNYRCKNSSNNITIMPTPSPTLHPPTPKPTKATQSPTNNTYIINYKGRLNNINNKCSEYNSEEVSLPMRYTKYYPFNITTVYDSEELYVNDLSIHNSTQKQACDELQIIIETGKSYFSLLVCGLFFECIGLILLIFRPCHLINVSQRRLFKQIVIGLNTISFMLLLMALAIWFAYFSTNINEVIEAERGNNFSVCILGEPMFGESIAYSLSGWLVIGVVTMPTCYLSDRPKKWCRWLRNKRHFNLHNDNKIFCGHPPQAPRPPLSHEKK